MAALLPVTAFAAPATSKTLFSFDLATTGASPEAALTLGSDGNFYGTTRVGNQIPFFAPLYANGTIFKMAPSGVLTTLYVFGSSGDYDGGAPYAPLTEAKDGNFYGLASGEVTSLTGTEYPHGTVFKIAPDGTFTVLHIFDTSDGAIPLVAPLVEGSDGDLYGVAIGIPVGFTPGLTQAVPGTFFKITPQGEFTVLHTFLGDSDGSMPIWLTEGNDGNFYGTTLGQAYWGTGSGFGTVFKMTPQGELTTLYTFQGGEDGVGPVSLVADPHGELFGVTISGGVANAGTVFKIARNGSKITLHSFDGSSEGAQPNPGLLRARDGNFYGTTENGGSANGGAIFRIGLDGQFSLVQSLVGNAHPLGGLVQGRFGNFFYGTTQGSGDNNKGTIYRLYVPWRLPSP
jgi:uncharacterized repeat protein (TIGR03803 family)